MKPIEVKFYLKQLIAENKTKAAIQHLLLLLKEADQNNAVVMQSGKFENLKSKLSQGIISHENATLEYNQINYALIQLIEEIDLEAEIDLPVLKDEEPAFVIRKKPKYLLLITLAVAVVGMITWVTLFFQSTSTFDFTVFLKAAPQLNKNILEIKDNRKQLQISKASIIVDFDGDRRKVQVSDNAEANFKVVASKFKGRAMKIELLSEHFKATHSDTLYTLQEGKAIYIEVALSGLDKVSGSVQNEKEEMIVGATVSINQITTHTDEFGKFTLSIPPAEQKQEQTILIVKEGYKRYEKFVYPETGEGIKAVLEK